MFLNHPSFIKQINGKLTMQAFDSFSYRVFYNETQKKEYFKFVHKHNLSVPMKVMECYKNNLIVKLQIYKLKITYLTVNMLKYSIIILNKIFLATCVPLDCTKNFSLFGG